MLETDEDIISYVEVIIQKDIELSRNKLTLKKGSVSIPGIGDKLVSRSK